MHTCVHAHPYTHMHALTCTDTCTWLCSRAHTCEHSFLCTCMHTYRQQRGTHVNKTCDQTDVHAYYLHMHTHIHAHTLTPAPIHTQTCAPTKMQTNAMCTRMPLTPVCTFAQPYVHVHACIPTCIYTHMQAHALAHIPERHTYVEDIHTHRLIAQTYMHTPALSCVHAHTRSYLHICAVTHT